MSQYIRWPSFGTFGSITLNGSTSGAITITVPAVVTSYTLILPATQGAANTFLKNDGAGNLSWALGSGGGGGFDSIGTFDAGVVSIDGLNFSGTTLFAQSADATHPGMVNIGAQTFAGDKVFTGHLTNSSLSANRAMITSTGGLFTTSPTTATELAFVNGVTSSIQTQLNGKQATLTIGDLTAAGTDGIEVTSGAGAVIGSGTSLAQHVADSTHNGYLSSADWSTFNDKQAAGNFISDLTGDVTASGPGSSAATLATVNSNVGSFGSSTAIPSLTINAKGLVTAASTNVVIAPAGTLTGTTLAANVVNSSLTSVGTIATGVWNGTAIPVANGGTGQTSYTNGQLLIGNTSGNTLTKTTLTQGTGITITNGGGSITIAATGSGSSVAPTVQKFTSSSGTYTTPTSPVPLYIRVTMVGGGGGGGGSGAVSSGTGGTGGTTTFGTTLLSASGGTGGDSNTLTGLGGNGGGSSLGSGPIGLALTGGNGSSANGSANTGAGGAGSGTPLGGSGGGGVPLVYGNATAVSAGAAGKTNTGSGGGGAGSSTGATGAAAGGGAGGYVNAIITSPTTTYAYAVGAAGTAGTAGTSGAAGGAGGSGLILVEEFYQ